MSEILRTNSLTLGYGNQIIINELNISIPKGEVTVLIGGNGCGKSTLLRAMARLLNPMGGSVLLEGKAIDKLSTKKVAKKLSILPQSPISPEGLTVLQLVKQGRYPYQNWLNQWSKEDEQKVMNALQATGLEKLQNKPVDELSGGQRQRAWIAMTLAQDTETILLDEPTTYLDMTHQIEILDLLFELNQKEKRTIIMVLHDLNLACRYAHHMIAIKDQTVAAQGKPEEIMDSHLVEQVYSMKCSIIPDPIYGTPLCIPYAKGRVISHSKQTIGSC